MNSQTAVWKALSNNNTQNGKKAHFNYSKSAFHEEGKRPTKHSRVPKESLIRCATLTPFAYKALIKNRKMSEKYMRRQWGHFLSHDTCSQTHIRQIDRQEQRWHTERIWTVYLPRSLTLTATDDKRTTRRKKST